MFNPKEDLLKEVEKYLMAKPEDSPEFLATIGKAMESYKTRVLELRNNQAENAISCSISFLLDSKKFKSLEETRVCYLIDLLFYIMPTGNIGAHSEAVRKVVAEFRKICKDIDILNNPSWTSWLEQTKGDEYYEWVKKVLEEEKND